MNVYDLNQVCEMLKMNKQTVRKYVRQGEIKASKVGTHYIVTDESIKEFLNARIVEPTQKQDS